MRQYDTYKDSGVDWIGSVPSHWDRCRFKDFEYLRTEKSSSKMKIGLENIESKTGKYLPTDSQFEGDGIAFYPNDVVYGKLRPYLQKVWLADFEGNAVGDFFVFKNKQNCNAKYLFYLMLSDGFTSECNGATLGAKMPRVSSEFIQGLRFFLPPTKEQKAIADCLDKKTAQIDSIIRAREKKIQLLEELRTSIISKSVTKGIKKNVETKDSGIAWIGVIPKHWEVRKLKYIAFLKSGDTIPPSQFTDDGYPVYGGNGFRGYTNKYNNEGKHILIGRQGALCGNINYADGKFYASEHAVVVYPHKNENLTWLGELLRISNLNQYSTSAAQPGLAVSNIVNISYPYPPEEERKEIAQYIEKNIDRIEKLIKRAKREIELFKEYRSSLITEVVTGKRKII